MLDSTRYFILRAVRNMRQWPLLCTVAILTMAVALTTVATFFLVVVNVEQLAQGWTKEIQVVAYLDNALPQTEIAKTVAELKQIPGVDTVIYVSQDEALQRFRKRLGNDSSLLEGISRDLLPASFELGLFADFRHQQGVETVVKQFEKIIKIEDVRYGQTWLERFNAFVDMLRFVGMVLGGFLLFAALFIVSNTIKLTLFARRDELEIMALVGATMRFIKVPFLLEGAIQGILGGLLSLVFLVVVFKLIIEQSIQSFWLTPVDFQILFLTINQQVALVVAGMLLGLLGSLTSLRKFVRL